MPVKGGGHVWVQRNGVITKNEFDGFPIAYSVMINVDDFVQIEKAQSIICLLYTSVPYLSYPD